MTPSEWAIVVAVLVAAYLIGAIPWGLIIGRRFFGIDPREHGSGNLGATNLFRLLGARAGIITLLLDAAKGAFAVAMAQWIVSEQAYGPVVHGWVRVLAMVAAVLGHTFSPYIGFKGGKGVATSAGGLLVLTPLAFLIELVIFIVVVASSRMVSLGSVTVAVAYPFLTLWLYPDDTALQICIFALAALVIFLHRANIARIWRREESKISLSRRGIARDNKQGE